MGMFPSSTERVQLNTSPSLNEEIEQTTKANIRFFSHCSKDEIKRRLRELDEEWDTERVLETSAAGFVITGTILGSIVNKKWHVLSGIVGIFLLQHALQGWCPPLPVIRSFGVRTPAEILEEKFSLLQILKERGEYV